MSTAEVCVQAVRASDLLLGHDAWGTSWIAAHRAQVALSRRRPRRMSAQRRCRAARARTPPRSPTTASRRVRLRFLPDGAEVRVPSGTPVFDAASWNGIAIDSTCGGHGTCKKCKVRIVSGEVPVGAVDPRAFSADELRDGWRLACRAAARGDLVVEVPPLADPAEGGARRRRPPRDPAPVGAEAPPRAGGAVDRGPALGPAARARRDRRPRAGRVGRAAAVARRHAAHPPASTSPPWSATRS